MRRSSLRLSPSSMMSAQLKNSGFAPTIARSLTVPQTAILPMSPPLKNRGVTTKLSVLKASSPLELAEFKVELTAALSKPDLASKFKSSKFKFSIALSLFARKISLSNAAKIVSLMSLFISSPPPPWLKSIVSFKFFLFTRF